MLAAPQGHAGGVGIGDGHGVFVVVKKDQIIQMAAHGLVKNNIALGGVTVAKEKVGFLRRGHAALYKRFRPGAHVLRREKGHVVKPAPDARLHFLIIRPRRARVGGVEGRQKVQAHPPGRHKARFLQVIYIRAQDVLKAFASGGKADADVDTVFVQAAFLLRDGVCISISHFRGKTEAFLRRPPMRKCACALSFDRTLQAQGFHCLQRFARPGKASAHSAARQRRMPPNHRGFPARGDASFSHSGISISWFKALRRAEL